MLNFIPSIQSFKKLWYKISDGNDLALIGKALTLSDLLKIENELDDLMMPYFIDLSLFYGITDPGFLQHINRVGLPFYTKKHLAAQLDS